MKRPILLLALLAAPRFVIAQPAAQPQLDAPVTHHVITDGRATGDAVASIVFIANEENARGIAMMGAFYNAFQNAKSYQGHFILTQTTVKDGKTTQFNSLDWDSTWQKEAVTGVVRSHAKGIFTKTQDGQTSTESVSTVNDGRTSNRAYITRGLWTTRPQTPTSAYDFFQAPAYLSWTATLLRVVQATNLQVVKNDDGTTRVSSVDGTYEAVFNARGILQSYKAKQLNDITVEVKIERLELNPALNNELFKWNIPEGAKQVAPDDARAKIDFSFGF